MGPNSLLAEITRPIDLHSSARPTFAPAETPAGRFSDRLRDALGAQRREPAHSLQESNAPVEDPLGETAQTSAPHPDQRSHGQDREETPLPDAPGQDVAPEVEQAAIPEPVVTAVEPPPGAGFSLSMQAASSPGSTDLAAPPQAPDVTTPGAKQPAAETTPPPLPATPAAGESNLRQPAPTDVGRQAVTELKPAAPRSNQTPGSAESPPVQDERESPPARRPLPVNTAQSAGRQDQPPVQRAASNVAELDPPQVAVKPEGRTDQPRRQTETQTVQGLKTDQSIGRSHQDLAGSRDPRAGTNGSNSYSTPDQMSGQGSQQPETRSVQASAELKFASAGSLQGDSPAASIAKFLLADISGSPGSDSVARGAADRPIGFTHLAADPTSPPPALARSPETFGGQVLASGAEGPDQLAAAARVLRASSGSGRFQVKMQLHPPELGQLKMLIQMQQQTLTLSIEVQTRAVAKLIESRLPELHEALATHGIRVDRTDVVTRSSAPADPQPQRQDSDQAAGDQADHPADQPPDTWTSDQGWPDAPPDHDSSASDSPGGLEDQTGTDLAAGRAEHPEPIDVARTTIRSLDLVA